MKEEKENLIIIIVVFIGSRPTFQDTYSRLTLMCNFRINILEADFYHLSYLHTRFSMLASGT